MPLRKDNIYKKVHLFDQEKSRIGQITHGSIGSSYCTSTNIKHDSIDNNYYENNCPISVDYLDNWKTKRPITGLDTYCICMYYWIYVEGFKNKYNYYIKTIYDEFLKAYEALDAKICNDYKEIITDDILGKLHDLYVMNCNLNKSNSECANSDKCQCVKKCTMIYMKYEKECELNKYIDFCKELDEFRTRYNDKMKTFDCPNIEYQMLPSFQTANIKVFVITPFAIILIISIFLAVSYKFTACSPYVCQRIIRNKNIYDDVNQENNMCKHKKIHVSMSTNGAYNILHNSQYY
ncbi:variable surface protein [Plasmodium gonderi]|uniref:Variable surface protein n=1 Tax=Plasmodium gonderi TaxID=77519 RepID=A0A1Y1JUE7_PLAGO|nr:variable surface protein [Plasmodium gonderi]GAW84372.1 variable surface protein [Plasmodium gonderi]